KLKGMKFSLQRSSSFFITPNDLISVDSNGHVYHFMFEMDSGNYVSNIVVKECDEVIPSYFAIHCMKDLVFIGGYENGSCLYSFKINSKRDIKITLLDKINILNFSSNSVASVVKYGSKMLQTIYNVEQINSKSSLVTSCTTEAFVEEINTLKLKEFQTFWPLYGYQSDENIDVANKGLCNKNLQYSYVILTNDNNSMIIKAKTGFSILTKTKFCTDKPTILAGNIGKNNYILQILNNSIGLFRDTKELQNIFISENILNVKINQSVICALCKPNTILSFSLNPKTEQLFEISKIILDVEIVDFSLGFLDKFMNSSFVDFYEAVDENNKPETSSLDIEEYLYGAPVFKKPKQANKILSQSESNKIRNLEHKKTFAFLLAEGSKLIIYDIENSKKIFESEGIDFLINTLENGFKEEKLLDLISTQTQRNPANTIEVIQYGHNYSKLDLLITNNSDVILYEGVKLKGSGQINLRFKRKKIVMPFSKIRKLIDISEIKDGEEKQYLVLGNENLTMIFFSERAEIASNLQVNLESHSCNDIIHIDRFINQINGANIGYLTSGGIFTMVYADIYESDHLNISDRYFFSSQVLNSKIESIVYHSASRSLFLINSEIHLTDELIKVHQETTEMEQYIVDDSFLLPDTKHFFISAIDCETFEEIPDSKIYFDLYDKFLDSKEASIIIGDDLYDVKNLLIVGTNTFHGEELPTRGHIHIYDIVEVNPEPDKPLTRRKLKHVLSEEQKGPLSAFCEIKGHICVALTNRIFLLSMHQNSKSLITVAFIDTLFYMNQITSFKNFLLCSDVLKSIYLLQMDSDKKVISLISRDVNNRSILASGFFPTGNTSLKSVDKENQSRDLFLAASDFNGNVYIFSHYSRALVNIQDSQRMGLIGKFHNGSCVRNFIHLLAKENRIYSVLCDTDGSLTTLSVLNESQYRRLSMLQ
ncbi:MAG: Cleavage and polyadenylation specificity factor subunit 1, partial [Paramarteilia canceri]